MMFYFTWWDRVIFLKSNTRRLQTIKRKRKFDECASAVWVFNGKKKKKLATSGLFAIKELIFIYSLLNLLYEGKKNLNMIKSCYNKIRINYYTTFFMHNLLLDLSENRGKKRLECRRLQWQLIWLETSKYI